MRRVLCLLTLLLGTLAVTAQRSQDFASKFLAQCRQDSAVSCVTVSPKMMEQMVKTLSTDKGDARTEQMLQAIAKLKSVRVVTVLERTGEYLQTAEQLLKKNARRFQQEKGYRTQTASGEFYSRKDRNGQTVELIMLHTDLKAAKMMIVNLTGTIDDDFINTLKNISMLSL